MDSTKYITYVQQSLGYIIILILIGVSLIFNKIAQDKIFEYFKKFYKKISGKDKKIISINEDLLYVFESVSSDLSILKSKLNCDRASIFEFHNGDYFISKNSRYKMSCTYEKVSPGVSSEALGLQNLDITLFWEDFLRPVLIKDYKDLPPGFDILEPSVKSCSLQGCLNNNAVFIVNVSNMSDEERIAKTILERQGIKFIIMQGIRNSKGVVYGYVVFDFLDDILNLNEIRVCDVCKFTKQIALLWESDEAMKTNAMGYKKHLFKN